MKIRGGGAARTLVVWKAFLAFLLKHEVPEIDVGYFDVREGGVGRHTGQATLLETLRCLGSGLEVPRLLAVARFTNDPACTTCLE